MFVYCLNNPVSGYDPAGTFAWIPFLIGVGCGGALGALSEWATGGSAYEIAYAFAKGAFFGGVVVIFPSMAPHIGSVELALTFLEELIKRESLESSVLTCLVDWLFSDIPIPEVKGKLANSVVNFISQLGIDLTSSCVSEISTSIYENFFFDETQNSVPVSPPYFGGIGGGPDNTKHMLFSSGG